MTRLPIARALLGAALLTAPLAAQAKTDTAPSTHVFQHRSTYEDMQMFSQVLNQIRVNHPDSIDTHELMMAAVVGMVHAADPHSFVIQHVNISPEKYRAYEDGKLYPVPISFEFKEGAPVVVGITPGSNAAHQDILVGDVLLAADSVPISSESPDELGLYLMGKKNTFVVLRFERERIDGSTVTLERVVKREKVEEDNSAVHAFMLDSTTGYIRVITFMAEKVADDLHSAVNRLQDHGMKRLILDLRDNGGGSVDEATRVAGEFLPSGTIVWTSKGRKPELTDTARVKRSFWKSEKRFPVVLMINSGSASASELVAGALQDHDRALIVGQPSFGKALIMGRFPLMDNSFIYLVIGHTSTPCGRVIQRQYHGISEHEYYRLASAERDTAGRPWCKTDNGRVVYGGGGIYPDIRLAPRPPKPLWMERLGETERSFQFVSAWMAENPSAVQSLDVLAANPHLPDGTIEKFRAFLAKDSLDIPPGRAADSLLERRLVQEVALAKWGTPGLVRIQAVIDADVRTAESDFDRAQQILGSQH
jgi:carboxyl-terminal processing protease